MNTQGITAGIRIILLGACVLLQSALISSCDEKYGRKTLSSRIDSITRNVGFDGYKFQSDLGGYRVREIHELANQVDGLLNASDYTDEEKIVLKAKIYFYSWRAQVQFGSEENEKKRILSLCKSAISECVRMRIPVGYEMAAQMPDNTQEETVTLRKEAMIRGCLTSYNLYLNQFIEAGESPCQSRYFKTADDYAVFAHAEVIYCAKYDLYLDPLQDCPRRLYYYLHEAELQDLNNPPSMPGALCQAINFIAEKHGSLRKPRGYVMLDCIW